jgi:hypothetical protein
MSEVDFSWDGPLKQGIWSLFDIGPKYQVKTGKFGQQSGGYGPSFDTLLTIQKAKAFLERDLQLTQRYQGFPCLNPAGS